jgi:hypothetical protein
MLGRERILLEFGVVEEKGFSGRHAGIIVA